VLQLKDLRGHGVREKATGWDREILEELEGLPGPSKFWVNGGHKERGTGYGRCQRNISIIADRYS